MLLARLPVLLVAFVSADSSIYIEGSDTTRFFVRDLESWLDFNIDL